MVPCTLYNLKKKKMENAHLKKKKNGRIYVFNGRYRIIDTIWY